MAHSPSAAPHAHRPRGHLTTVGLILVLVAVSLAPAIDLRPSQRPATAAQADGPLAPEVLTWRQRTAEEWASAQLKHTTLAAGGGVALAEAAFVLSDAGEFDDTIRYTNAIAPFDADGDGDIDLALGNEGPSRALLLNDGTGVFTAVDAGALGATQFYNTKTLTAFDADGDGDIDLALGNTEEDPNALFLNDGAGYFVRGEAGDFGSAASFADTLLAFDADEDGDMDLASGHQHSALFLNNGAGRFTCVTSGDFYDSNSAVLAALDADGDGDIDLATPGRLYRNDGAGSFTLSPAGDFASASGPALAAFDANGDGTTDLATPGQFYLNDGAGSFSLTDAGDFTISGLDGQQLLGLDADGDGDLDLALIRHGGTNAIYLNDASGVFTQVEAGQFDDGAGYYLALAALDADGDGAPDLALAGGAGPRTFLYRNQGGGRFDLVNAGDLSNEARDTRALAAFDANGDGATDLAIGGAPNALYFNEGNGRFVRAADDDYTGAGNVRALAPVDVDGDGDIDLATANGRQYGGEANRLFLNDGSGGLTLVEAGAFDDPTLATNAIFALDADRDGDADLVVGNENAANALYLNTGQGSFVQADAGDFDDTPLGGWLTVIDADGDNDQDLAVSTASAPCALYRNNGAGVFHLADAGDCNNPEYAGGIITALDADGDGDLDLVVLGLYTPGLYLNNDQGWFTRRADSGLDGVRGAAVTVIDYDGDGDIDLAIGRESGETYLLLNNDGTGRFADVFSGNLSTSPIHRKILAVLDADGDGDQDLARPGEVLVYENLFDSGSVASPVIDPAQLYPNSGHLLAWQRLTVQEVLPPDSDVRYDILDAASGAVIPGFANLRPNAAGQIDLAGLSAAAYPVIHLRATLRDLHSGSDYLDRTPRLYEWSVGFTMTTEEQRRTVDVYRVDTPPVVDGNLGDWPAQAAAIELTLHSADTVRTQPAGGPPPQPADSSALLWAAWTDDALYLAVHVRDEVIVNDSPDVWRDDEIELAFDGLRDLQSRNQDDHQYTVNPDGRLTDFGDPGSHPSIQVGVRPVVGGWDVEARIPAARLHAGALHLSQEIGFSLGLHDDDDGGNWDSYLIWEGTNTWSGASGFGVLRLSGPYGAPTWWQRSLGDWHESRLAQTAIDRPVVQPVEAGDVPAAPILALDADGDDDLDLVGFGVLYKNDGLGGFVVAGAGDFDGQTGHALVALDADGDGDADLAVSGSAPSNRLFLNNGAGAFSLSSAGQFSQDTGGPVLLAFDADGDRDVDLASPGRLYLNNGSGVYARYGGPSQIWAAAMAALDVDEDGDLDVVVGSSGPHENPCYYDDDHNWICEMAPNALFLNDGVAIFTRVPVPLFGYDWSALSHFTEHLVTFDADGDGDTDLMSGNFGYCQYYPQDGPTCGGISDTLFVNDGAGYFGSSKRLGGGWTTGLAALDLDGDRVTDIALAHTGDDPWDWVMRPHNSIHRNDGRANFASLDVGAFARTGSGSLVSLDADGDGLDDLALAGALYQSRWNDDACVVLSSAGFALQPGQDREQTAPSTVPQQCIEIPIDFDNDGDDDRVGGCNYGRPGDHNWADRNNGGGSFTRIDAGDFDDFVSLTNDLVAFDADGDGDQDLALAADDSRAKLFHNDGTGVFTLVEAGDFDDHRNAWGVAASDADGDGDQDLTLHQYGDTVYLYENLHASGSVLSTVIAPLDLYPGSLQEWGVLAIDEVLEDETTITYDVVDPATGQPLPGFANLRPNAAGQISLAGIDPYWHRSIQLRAHLADLHSGSDYLDRSPKLCGWQVSFNMWTEPEPTPTATQTHTPTTTPTSTPTPTHTATPSPTPTHTMTATATPSPTATSTATPTASPSPSATATATLPAPTRRVFLPLIMRSATAVLPPQAYLPLIMRR